MPNYNKVILVGHLTKDPQVRTVKNDMVVCNGGLGVTTKRKNGEDTLFIDFSAFGKTGELIGQYCKKGDPLLIDGRLRLEEWEKDGQKKSRISVAVDNVQFLGGGKSRERAQVAQGTSAPTVWTPPEMPNDDIPF